MSRKTQAFDRRSLLIAAGATAASWSVGAIALDASKGLAAPLPSLPTRPVPITIIDVAGQLQLTKSIIDEYGKTHGQFVSQINYERATAPELPAKIKAQQAANQVVISMVLTGSDGLSSGIVENIWEKLLPTYDQKFPGLMQRYIQPKAEDLAQGYGILDVFGNYGPTFTYNPAKLPSPPKSATALLDWAKAHNGQLIYARPANSGPGRSLLMGLPYVLGETEPRNPEAWTKVWPYLEELGKYIQYYPSGTAPTFQELGQGARTIAASTMGWDMNVRVLGTVPKNFGAFVFDNQSLVADTQYVTVPKGLQPQVLAVVLDLIDYILTPSQQAKTYDNAYFYPGPAIKGVTLAMAPKDDQDAVRSVARPEFDRLIKTRPIEMPLDAPTLVKAFEIWDQRVGGSKLK